jgi:hypothetical protein
MEEVEICALLSYYAVSYGNFYRRFGTTYLSHLHGSRVRVRKKESQLPFHNVPIEFFQSLDSSSGPRPLPCRSFEIALRHTTLGRIPMDE